MKWQSVDTRKGTHCRVLEGGSGAPLVFFHSAGGLLAENPFVKFHNAERGYVRCQVTPQTWTAAFQTGSPVFLFNATRVAVSPPGVQTSTSPSIRGDSE